MFYGRFLHTADWHLGAPQHHKLYKEQMLPRMFDLAREVSVDFVLVVGDIFDRPNPDQATKDYLLEQLIKNEDIRVVFVAGNHDYTTKSKSYHSLRYLSILEKHLAHVRVYEVSDRPYRVVEGGFNLIVLPPDFKGVQKYKTNKDPTIIACHGVVPGLAYDPSKIPSSSKKFINKLLQKSEYVALGHIHKHIKLHDRCWYPGALVQKTYSCESGLVLVDFSYDNFKYIVETKSLHLDVPKKFNLSILFTEGEDSEADIVRFVKKNISKGSLVRLVFNLPASVYASIDKQYLKKELVGHLSELKLENDVIKEARLRKNAKKFSKAKTLDEEIKTIIEGGDFGLDLPTLEKYCKRYYD